MDGTNGLKETTLSVNVFAAPGKSMVDEQPRPFGEPLGFDPITSTLIFGEHDAVLVDAMTVAEAEALADWIALHNRNSRLLDREQVAEVLGTSEKSICQIISAWRWGRPGGTNEEGIQAR